MNKTKKENNNKIKMHITLPSEIERLKDIIKEQKEIIANLSMEKHRLIQRMRKDYELTTEILNNKNFKIKRCPHCNILNDLSRYKSSGIYQHLCENKFCKKEFQILI